LDLVLQRASADGVEIMDTDAKNEITDRSKKSFFDYAGLSSFIIPFLTIVIVIAEGYALEYFSISKNLISQATADSIDTTIIVCAFFIQAASFILGLISLFGMNRHKRKLTILWALLGILASGITGLLALYAYLLTGLGHNC
jgi:hypothetical protein